MVKFLEPEASPKQDLYESLTTSISDMIGSYERRKQSENLANLLDIPKDKRSEFASLPPEWQKFYAQNVQRERTAEGKQAAAKEKLLAGAGKYIKGELASRLPPDSNLHLRQDEITEKYLNYIRQNVPQSEALQRAISDLSSAEPDVDEEGESGGFLGSLLGGMVGADTFKDLFKPSGERHPSGVPSAKERAESEYPYGYASAVKKHPLQSAADLLLTPLAGLEDIGRKLSMMPPGKGSGTPITDWLREKAGLAQLPQEAQQELGIGSTALSTLLPLEGVVNELALGAQRMGGVAGKVPRPRPPVRPELIEGAAYKELPFKGKAPPAEPIPSVARAAKPPIELDVPLKTRPALKEPAVKPSEPPALKSRITEPPATATEMRMERLRPSAKVYPRYQNVLVREQQVKNFPKYADEIHADAVKRAEQAEKRIPKTVKGRESQAIRIHEAEKAYPVAQEGYFKAAARVRALEEQMAKLSAEKQKEIEPLYTLAKQELQEAEFYRKQAFENLKGLSKRAGLVEMRQAAQKKLTEIADTIAEGEEYQLAKMDYSPDLIKEAERISKKKPLPFSRGDDFYNAVHETYANEYRKRLDQINKEMADLAKEKGLGNVYQRQRLAKEKDIINKMIQSAEAEKKIHYHKFGLRQMAERNKAAQRFAKFQKAEGKPEVGKVAQERMWKSRIQEAKTPEARAEVISEAAEQIAAKDPKNAEKIRAEAEELKDAVENLFASRGPKEPPSGAGARMETGGAGQKPPPPPPKAPSGPGAEELPKYEEIFSKKTGAEAAKEAQGIFKNWKKEIDELVKSFPFILRSPLGRDLVVGVGAAYWDEIKKDYDLPVSGSTIAAVTLGRSSGSGIRIISNQLAKAGFRKWNVIQAEKALKQKDMKKFSSYSKSIQKEAKEKARSS